VVFPFRMTTRVSFFPFPFFLCCTIQKQHTPELKSKPQVFHSSSVCCISISLLPSFLVLPITPGPLSLSICLSSLSLDQWDRVDGVMRGDLLVMFPANNGWKGTEVLKADGAGWGLFAGPPHSPPPSFVSFPPPPHSVVSHFNMTSC
jgi:hypothetical protein